jgi:hypothetical protein
MSERIVWEGHLALDVPDGWESGTENGVITIYDPDGVGALQLSFLRAKKTTVVDTEHLARVFARDRGWTDVALVPVQLGGVAATYFESSSDEEYWRVWTCGRHDRGALVTYNCDESDRDRERTLIDGILGSIEWPR